MPRALTTICAVPSQLRYKVEINLFLESLRENSLSNTAHVLIFESGIPGEMTLLKQGWDDLIALYPEAKFFFYNSDTLRHVIGMYTPITRLFMLKKHFEVFPELEKNAILYLDSDILFLQPPNIQHLLEDDINYLTNTVNPSDYLSHEYWDVKTKDVRPDKLEEFKKRDVVKELGEFFGLSRAFIESQKNNTGGAQYILKNITSKFWERAFSSCLNVRVHLQSINQQFFPGNTIQEREDNGFQSWCADMVAILYGLWADGAQTRTPKELDSVWSSDSIKKLEDNPNISILHNAGITSATGIRTHENDPLTGKKVFVDSPAYLKNKTDYKLGLNTPFRDEAYINSIIFNPRSQQYCTSLYAKHIIKTKNKYNLNY